MDNATRVQALDVVVCISQSGITLRKGLNLTLLPLHIGK